MKRITIISLFLLSLQVLAQSGNTNGVYAFLSASLFNKNVYKTQDTLLVTPIFKDKKYSYNPLYALKNDSTYKIVVNKGGFIRYKVIREDATGIYIRVLKGCKIDTLEKTIAIKNEGEDASNFICKIKDKELSPIKKYLSSSALMGIPIILPIRIRNLDSKPKLSAEFNISYAFGWKIKIGNHPFRSHYFKIIPYATGINIQKYFYEIDETSVSEKTDALSFTYYSFGISYEWERFNIGAFAGWDMMFGNNSNWVYNKKMWIGFGIGYDLIKD